MLFWRKTDKAIWKPPFPREPSISTNPPTSEQFFHDPLCPNFKNKNLSSHFRGEETVFIFLMDTPCLLIQATRGLITVENYIYIYIYIYIDRYRYRYRYRYIYICICIYQAFIYYNFLYMRFCACKTILDAYMSIHIENFFSKILSL